MYAYHLLDFAAAKVTSATTKQVQVIWKTENEQNYTRFTVERSIDDGKTFDILGSVPSNAQGTYSVLDKKPIVGQNLYRLKQEDINSTISYSKIVPVEYSDLSNNLTKSSISIYPNPASSLINLEVSSGTKASHSYNIRITNSVGMVVRDIKSSQSIWQGSINELMAGTYLIQVVNIKDNSLIGKTKFVKL
jgi:hypothetical protein